jgi:predicted DNA-binding protein with PD1-like motif
MKWKQLADDGDSRTFALAFAAGDEVVHELVAWSRQHRIEAATFTGIGAFEHARLGFFDLETREYAEIVMDEQVEVLSLAGNVSRVDDDHKIHAHVVVGKRDGTAHGGHLLSAHVRPTLELVVIETPAPLRRRLDETTGLPLLALD